MAGRSLGRWRARNLNCSALGLSQRCFSGGVVGGNRGWRNETPAGSKTEVFVYSRDSNINWPDPQLGVLGPTDPSFTLPGNVGISSGNFPENSSAGNSSSGNSKHPDVLYSPTNKEKQAYTLYNANDFIKYTPGSDSEVCSDILESFPPLPGMIGADLEVHEAPILLRKQMKDLFPGQNLEAGPFTIITLAQRTDNDMSKWSSQVEEERELKTEHFIQAAKEICGRLKEDGYWADFIDPCSGTPYFGPHTNTTMFETDEKYRLLGFRIEDLGCCKVISSAKYGRNVFVGCVVTNASKSSVVLEDIFCDLLSASPASNPDISNSSSENLK